MTSAVTSAVASEVSAVIPVPPGQAFRLLEDPSSFRDMVAGVRRIRRFDSRWPEPGTRLEHTVGIPPLLVRDHTEVVEQRSPHHLVLDARVRPFGRLRVEFLFEEHPEGAVMTVSELPAGGLVGWPLMRTATRLALQVRNREICRRFKKLAERRDCSAGVRHA